MQSPVDRVDGNADCGGRVLSTTCTESAGLTVCREKIVCMFLKGIRNIITFQLIELINVLGRPKSNCVFIACKVFKGEFFMRNKNCWTM